MEKVSDSHSPVVLSKAKDGSEKIILNFNFKTLFEAFCCFLFSSASVFSAMLPFGIGFYGARFSKQKWILNFVASLAGVFLFYEDSPWVYAAAIALVTAALGVMDFDAGTFKVHILTTASFFVLKLLSLVYGGFITYDIFALILESALVFSSVYIFQKAFPVVTAIAKRSFVSTSETLCSMTFLALAAMAVSDIDPIYGFSVSGVLSIFFIYVFSLGGINGGAVVLGVLLGTIGSLKLDSFALTTGTYAIGALLGSALCSYGKMAVVLGFAIANTASSIILTDASLVAVSIYDALGAAVLFALVPGRFCSHLSEVFSDSSHGYAGGSSALGRSQARITARLDEMSQSFRELSSVYSSGMGARELGKDYVMSKFRQVTSAVCTACPSKGLCFKDMSSKGYRHMSKMLETSFKTGKISVHTMPAEFRSMCRRCDTFAEKFNSAFDVIKLERQWLSKLNDSRQLISRQLVAIADALVAERDKCTMISDPGKEEAIRAELDKAMLYPKSVIAEGASDGSFAVTAVYSENRIKDTTLDDTARVISEVMSAPVSAASPKRKGEDVIYSFYPSHDYSVSVGYAMETKTNETKSGDSIKVINPDGKTVFAMLSDGMGSGEGAARESRDAITLMEKFIRAGFDSDTAVRLINSSLLLKSSRDSFSTIDLCKCSLAEASVVFTKLGAAASFIKSDGKISCIKGSSLPAGILKEIEVENHYLAVNGDTIIVMVSDGIGDIALKNKEHDGWLEEELMSFSTSNPQIIATKLMKKAMTLQEGIVHDDMTVVVVSIKKV